MKKRMRWLAGLLAAALTLSMTASTVIAAPAEVISDEAAPDEATSDEITSDEATSDEATSDEGETIEETPHEHFYVNVDGLLICQTDDVVIEDGFCTDGESGIIYLVKDGVIVTDANGLVKDPLTGKWGNLAEGALQVGEETVEKNAAGWWYVDENGYVDFTYNGFAANDNGTWVIQNGKVNFNVSGVVRDQATGKWGYVVKGQLQTGNETVEKNSSGWWYIGTDGYVDFEKNTVAKNSSGWWAIENGKVNFNLTGCAENENGIWYCQNGKVNFNATGVMKDNVTGKWVNVSKGKVLTGQTLAKNSNGWYYIGEDGTVDFTYNGFVPYNGSYWLVQNGKVNFNVTSVVKDEATGKWGYIVKGQLQTGKETVAKNSSGWYYIGKDGYVDFEVTTLAQNSSGWWRVENGKVNFNFEGFADNAAGWWYVSGGKVQFATTSLIKGTIEDETAWWYVEKGQVKKVTTVAINSAGAWYVVDGKVDFTYNGTTTYNGKQLQVKDGVVLYTGWYKNTSGYYYLQDGKMAKNTVVDGYKLDANGFSKTKTLVTGIASSITTNAMSDRQKINACWRYVVNNNWTYTRTYEHVASSWKWYNGWTDDFAYYLLTKHTGNCFRYAAGFGYLVKESTGLPVMVYQGQTPAARGGVTPHGWVTVYENGAWYAYDPDMYKFASASSKYGRNPYSSTKNTIHLYGTGYKIY